MLRTMSDPHPHARLGKAEVTALRRAGWLHDLGRLSVPDGIWGKRGRLTPNEWERVRLHPYHTERILARSGALAPLAALAGMHHERQDGSGYYRQASGAAIPVVWLQQAGVPGDTDEQRVATFMRTYPAAANMPAELRRLLGY